MKKNFFFIVFSSLILMGTVISLSSYNVIEYWTQEELDTSIPPDAGTFPDTYIDTGTGSDTATTKTIYISTEGWCPGIVTSEITIVTNEAGVTTTTKTTKNLGPITLTPSTTYSLTGILIPNGTINLTIPIGAGKNIEYTEVANGKTIAITVKSAITKRTQIKCTPQSVPIGNSAPATCDEYDCTGAKTKTYSNT